MIGFITLGTNDLARAAGFYDGLLSGSGGKRLIDTGAFIAWGKGWDETLFAVKAAADGDIATPGHGASVALVQSSRAQVDKQYARALELGAEDESPPAFRGEEGEQAFYAGYCRDADGHQLCLYYLGPRS